MLMNLQNVVDLCAVLLMWEFNLKKYSKKNIQIKKGRSLPDDITEEIR